MKHEKGQSTKCQDEGRGGWDRGIRDSGQLYQLHQLE